MSTPVWLPFRYAVPWMVLHRASWADISLSCRPDICPPGPATDIWCRAGQISAAAVTRYPVQDWPDICPGVLDQISGACYWQISCGWLGRGPDIWGPLRQIIWPRQPRPDICPPKVTRFWEKSGTSNRYLPLWGDIWSANEPATSQRTRSQGRHIHCRGNVRALMQAQRGTGVGSSNNNKSFIRRFASQLVCPLL